MTCQTRRGWRNRVLIRRSPCVRGLPHRARTSGHPRQARERRDTRAAEACWRSVLIRWDATRTGARHLVLPFEAGANELDANLASPSDDQRDRPFRGQLALAGVAGAESRELGRALLQPLVLRRPP